MEILDWKKEHYLYVNHGNAKMIAELKYFKRYLLREIRPICLVPKSRTRTSD